MSTETKEIEIAIEHPLESAFDIEAGTTLITRTEKTTDLIPSDEYDDKDNEIENQFEEIYNSAFAAFEDMSSECELVEGKYKARIGEVANQSLSIALAAAKEKSTVKQHKDKTAIAKGKLGGSTTNNTLIVADRNDILKSLLEKD